MYAQDHEDDVVIKYFQDDPRPWRNFLDIGAFDGVTNSNSRALLELGWTGVMVEGSITAFSELLRHHGSCRGVRLVHAVVGTEHGMTPWHEHAPVVPDGSGLGGRARRPSQASTTMIEQRDRVMELQAPQASDEWREMWQPQCTVDDLLGLFGGERYDYVSIDTEGTSVLILEQLDLARAGASIVCVEHNEKSAYVPRSIRDRKDRERIIAHCARYGLSQVLFENGVNVICARPEPLPMVQSRTPEAWSYGRALQAVHAHHCLKVPEVELPQLLEAFRNAGGKRFLEIGTFRGATVAAVALCFPEAEIWTLDLPDPTRAKFNPQDKNLTGIAYRELELEHRIHQLWLDSEHLQAFGIAKEIEGQAVPKGPFDVVFVDGDHSEDVVYRDVSDASVLVQGPHFEKTNGVVIVHDYTDETDRERPEWTQQVYRGVARFLAENPGWTTERLGGWLVALHQEGTEDG